MASIDRTARIEVACLVGFDDLDPEDRAADGSCAVDGSYRLRITDIPEGTRLSAFTEKALDHFHARVPIACLEDFNVIVTLDRTGAMDARDLGAVGWLDAPAVPAGGDGLASGDGQDHGLPTPSPGGTTDPFDPFRED